MAQVQEIVDLVLQALAANAKTIDDLTEVLNVGESDFIELNGGRKISVNKLAELVGGSMAEVTHAELKALRDGGALVAGKQYRITDYVCTTVQENTQAADHQFDIIVTADDASTLNENARACLHDGDEYFAGCKLEAWKLKYTIDNDPERFVWADEENGKGVIYQMIDEWNNDCPYDFKNIMFKRKVSLENGYPELDPNAEEMWVYTFTATSKNVTTKEWSGIKDGSLESPYGHESDENTSTYWGNVIKPYFYLYDGEDEDYTKTGKTKLNDIVFLGYFEEVGTANPEDYPYYYAYCSYSNTFGYDCNSNTFGYDCNYNTFGNKCEDNTFGYDCNYNTFGSECRHNTFGRTCISNTFGNKCEDNTFSNGCCYNTFGSECNYNTFGSECRHNTFEDWCRTNSFGDNCKHNTFGSECRHNTFGTSAGVKHYYRYITFESGVQYTYLNCTATPSSSSNAQNVHVNSGVAGTSQSNRKTLTLATAGNAFLTTFGSSSDVKIDV